MRPPCPRSPRPQALVAARPARPAVARRRPCRARLIATGCRTWAAAGLAATTALELGAWLAATARDPALLPLVVRALEVWTERSRSVDRPRHSWHPFAVALRELLRCGGEVTPAVHALARHPEAQVRAALVEGLAGDPSTHRELLLALAGDPDARVRRDAREALEGVAEPPWWAGVFPRDPGGACGTARPCRAGRPR